VSDPALAQLRLLAEAASKEVERAIILFETARPARTTPALFDRFADTSAASAFVLIRTSLHRETALALCRIWDTQKGSKQNGGKQNGGNLRMEDVRKELERPATRGAIKRLFLTGSHLQEIDSVDDTQMRFWLEGLAAQDAQSIASYADRRAQSALKLAKIIAYLKARDELCRELGDGVMEAAYRGG
jgi:hypothetical protein